MNTQEPILLEELDHLGATETQTGNIEVKSIKELDKTKIYHVAIDNENTHSRGLRMFVEAAKALDLKMLITLGETTVEQLGKTLDSLPQEQKTEILRLLGYVAPSTEINPLEHEQSK